MKTNNRRGNILIEAVIATMIIAIGLTLVMQSLLNSYKGLHAKQDYFVAINYLEDELARAWVGGVIEDGAEGLQGDSRMKVDRVESDKGQHLKQSQIEVQWASGKKQRQITATTFVYSGAHDQVQTGT